MLTKLELEQLFAGFPAWVRTKDPNEQYIYSDHQMCAFAQYLTATGHQDVIVYAGSFRMDGFSYALSHKIDEAVFMPHGYEMCSNHRTFGMLAASFPDVERIDVLTGPLVAGNL